MLTFRLYKHTNHKMYAHARFHNFTAPMALVLILALVGLLFENTCARASPLASPVVGQGQVQARSISNRVPIKAQELAQAPDSPEAAEDPAVTKFREYLRINTGPPNPEYETAIEWFRAQSDYYGLEFDVIRFQPPDLFAVIFTWQGSNPNPSLKSVLLNSHLDVVEANNEKWVHDPFGAHKDEQGNIFGRGARDMKSSTIGQLEALRQLRLEGFRPLRTVHVSILPDEEFGGVHGMKAFTNSPQFQALNVGFDLDESGQGSIVDGRLTFPVPYAQKSAWQFNITAEGVAGHGSSIAAEGTAGQKLNHVISRLFELKESEAQKLKHEASEEDITSVNLVRIGGGIANNVIPSSMWAVFDMRIRVNPADARSWNFTQYERFLDEITAEAGEGVSVSFMQKAVHAIDTSLDPVTNVWWATLKGTCDKMNWSCPPQVSSPSSDVGYVRDAGIPAVGLVPRVERFTGGLGPMHGDNEGINEQDFLDSIERYKVMLKDLLSVPEAEFDR